MKLRQYLPNLIILQHILQALSVLLLWDPAMAQYIRAVPQCNEYRFLSKSEELMAPQ